MVSLDLTFFLTLRGISYMVSLDLMSSNMNLTVHPVPTWFLKRGLFGPYVLIGPYAASHMWSLWTLRSPYTNFTVRNLLTLRGYFDPHGTFSDPTRLTHVVFLDLASSNMNPSALPDPT